MEAKVEYIQLFMEYESDDMPVVYFYEVDLNNQRLALRAIEVFVNRKLTMYNDLYCDVTEVVPIPTVDEFNAKVWGENFHAVTITKEKFNEIWNSGVYTDCLRAK